MSIKNKLNRLKPHLTIEAKKDSMMKYPMDPSKMDEIPFIDIWESHGFAPYYVEDQYCLVRETKYPLDWQHGRYRFSDFLHAVKAWNETEMNHTLSARGKQPQDLFFFDTETTGLGAGVGNTIFLLGQACVTNKEVIVKQHILPNPGAEVPLYQSFLESIDYSNMVTYNGRAFDWPAVKTRHTLIREHVPKLPSFGHFDLYHAARRIWKHRLERLKLSVVEKEILEFERIDDIPGFLAPMIYFDFIESKNPQGMLGIIKHNELDILSLITLYTHLTFQLLRSDSRQTGMEIFEVGRWYSYLGETMAAEKVFSELSEGDSTEAVFAKHELAFRMKKKKDWNKAVELWKEVVEQDAETAKRTEACIELAKIYEHQWKHYEKAMEMTKKAANLQPNQQQDEFNKRLNRLQRKLAPTKLV